MQHIVLKQIMILCSFVSFCLSLKIFCILGSEV